MLSDAVGMNNIRKEHQKTTGSEVKVSEISPSDILLKILVTRRGAGVSNLEIRYTVILVYCLGLLNLSLTLTVANLLPKSTKR